MNAVGETVATYDYDEVGRLKIKKFYPDQTFTTGGAQDYINRPPSPNANIDDIARKAINLNEGTVIDAASITKYSATIDPNATGGINIQGLQTIDYSYHIRGSLRGINLDNAGNPIPDATQGDLFSYKLDYETVGFYDGNIGKQTWQSVESNSPLGIRSYTYNYDPVSRLKSATYAGINGEDYSLPNLSYNKNGNIINLQRKGKDGSSFGDIDNLSYTYSGNRLSTVTDSISGDHEVDLIPRGSGNYTYYTDGSLKSDENEQISNIIYDSYLKQPKEINLSDGRWIKYYYNGGGALLKTLYSTNESWEYGGKLIYKNGIHFQISQHEGRLIYENNDWKPEFQYSDHLGNNRIAFSANGIQLEKKSDTSFDPWGVILNGINQINGSQNRFEFQGKEKESTFNLNRIDLGARTINPTIGRFDRVDPLAHEFFETSPFVFVLNHPIGAVDPDGKRVYFIGGANNDSDGWNYINRWGQAFRNAGVNFYRVNASHGKAGDIFFTSLYRNSGLESVKKPASVQNYVSGLSQPAFEYTSEYQAVREEKIDATLSLYKKQLKENPLKEGEQLNLAGYSYGSVLQAQVALQLASDGQVIDNLILIGSPISDKSDLWKQLNSNKNIKKIIRHDIKGDLLSNPQDIYEFLGGAAQNSSDNGPHFDLARPGKKANQDIQKVIQWLQKQGVKN